MKYLELTATPLRAKGLLLQVMRWLPQAPDEDINGLINMTRLYKMSSLRSIKRKP